MEQIFSIHLFRSEPLNFQGFLPVFDGDGTDGTDVNILSSYIRKKYIRKSQSLQEVRINMKLKTRKRMQWMVWRCYNAKLNLNSNSNDEYLNELRKIKNLLV